MTGLVENQEVRIEAVRLVWEVEGIKEVNNEIEIGNRDSIKEYANDVWITTQARAIATKTIGFRAIAYNFETINGKIYIAGITSRPEQLDSVIEALKVIKGVKEATMSLGIITSRSIFSPANMNMKVWHSCPPCNPEFE